MRRVVSFPFFQQGLSDNSLCGVKRGRGNYDASGIQALAEALKVNGVLTELQLGANEIRDEGAKALASALRVNGVLTSLDVSYNSLGDEGKGAIRDAVSGREGFELEM